MSIALCHHQTVLVSLEKVSLVQHLVSTSDEVALPEYIYESAPLPVYTKSGGLLLVSVEIDNQGKPKTLGVEISKFLTT